MKSNTKTSNLIKSLIVICDFLVLNVLFYLYIRHNWAEHDYTNGARGISLVLIANMGMVCAQAFFSTIVHERRTTSERILRQSTLLVLMFGLFTFVMTYGIFQYEKLPVPDIRFSLYSTLVVYVGILLSRYCERWAINSYRSRGRNSRSVVFVGSDPLMIKSYNFLVGSQYMGYNIVGYYADADIEGCPDELVRKGSMKDFERLMENGELAIADELYCSLPITKQDSISRIMRYCSHNVIHFYYIPSFAQVFGHSLKFENLGDTVVFTNYDEPLVNPTNRFVKRAFDVVISAFVLLCLLPFLPLIFLIIKLQSPGPIFFRQSRTGLNGVNFTCYKFRSMHVNKDADLVQATENDPRKFAFGNFMRKSNIDELPQFFNVLRGDMSIVGPRPHMLHHTEVYSRLIDKYMVRHFVKPGITGWAQVTGFRGETKELWQMEGRIQRDIWYIENWSIWLDIRIMAKTAKQIFVRDKQAY